MDNADDTRTYTVLINDEGQYSLWVRGIKTPEGWRGTGVEGSKAECARYVDEVWTDMRPLSLQRKMAGRVQ